MAVTSTTRRQTITGDDTTGPYTVNIVVQNDTDLLFTDSSGNTLVLDTDYTLNSTNTEVTFTSAVDQGDTVTVTRNHSFLSSVDLKNTGGVDAEVIEDALDKLIMLAQQLDEQQQRTLTLAITSTLTGLTITPDAGKFLKWNSAGTGIEGDIPTGGGLTSLVTDTSPVLGGDLDVGTYEIVSSSNNDIGITPNGTGSLYVKGNSTQGALFKLGEDTDNGTNTIGIQAPASLSSNVTLTLPSSDGSAGQVLSVDGSGQLSFSQAKSRVLLETKTASSSANIAFTSNIDSTYDKYEIEVTDYLSATNGTSITMQTSTNAGSSYSGGASDYRYVETSTSSNGATAANADDAHTGMIIFTGAYANSEHPTHFTVKFDSPDNTTTYKTFEWSGAAEGYNGSTRRGFVFQGAGTRLSTADIDAIKFTPSTGNITSGTFKLYGIVTS